MDGGWGGGGSGSERVRLLPMSVNGTCDFGYVDILVWNNTTSRGVFICKNLSYCQWEYKKLFIPSYSSRTLSLDSYRKEIPVCSLLRCCHRLLLIRVVR